MAWQDKVVLVTGGSSGLGRVIAEEFAAAGAKLAIVGLEPPAIQQTVAEMQSAGIDALGIPADITRQEDVDRIVPEVLDRFGRLDVLVNNAGRSMRGKLADTTAEQFRDLMELNLIALVRCTRAALGHLLERRGHVVNIGSLASKSAARWVGAYPATKFAVAAYSQQLRLELGPAGLHVLLVCPGPIARKDARLYPLEGLEDLPFRARRRRRRSGEPDPAAEARQGDPSRVRDAARGDRCAAVCTTVVRSFTVLARLGRLAHSPLHVVY